MREMRGCLSAEVPAFLEKKLIKCRVELFKGLFLVSAQPRNGGDYFFIIYIAV